MFGKANQNEKDWWAPVFRSFISYKNYKNIGNALWLYLYFLLYADRKTGILFRKYKTIKKDLGVSKKTIQRWLKRLRKCGYLVDKNLGRGLLIVIKRTNLTTLKGQKCHSKRTNLPFTGKKVNYVNNFVQNIRRLLIWGYTKIIDTTN